MFNMIRNPLEKIGNSVCCQLKDDFTTSQDAPLSIQINLFQTSIMEIFAFWSLFYQYSSKKLSSSISVALKVPIEYGTFL